MFFSKSSDKPPGEGVDEELHSSPKKYEELARVKNWRRMLSNFYSRKFELDGLQWISVENFYQASKFKKRNPKWYREFSLNSESKISKSPLLAKKAGGKTGGGLRPKNIHIDPDFFTHKNEVFYRAMLAKFSQNPDLKRVLLSTKDAQLLHKTRGVPLHRIKPLERVRQTLKEQKIPIFITDSLTFDYVLKGKTKRHWGYILKAETIESHKDVFVWATKKVKIQNFDKWLDNLTEIFSEACPPEVFCILEVVQADWIGLVTEYIKGYSLHQVLDIENLGVNPNHLCFLYRALLRGIDFFYQQGFQHGNIGNGSDIIFSTTKVKIGGVPKLIPIEKELPLTDRDTYKISVIIDNLVRGQKIANNFRKALNMGMRQKDQVSPKELLNILSCKS